MPIQFSELLGMRMSMGMGMSQREYKKSMPHTLVSTDINLEHDIWLVVTDTDSLEDPDWSNYPF